MLLIRFIVVVIMALMGVGFCGFGLYRIFWKNEDGSYEIFLGFCMTVVAGIIAQSIH